MIFRLAVIDLHICTKYPFIWRFFWIFIHKNLFGWLLMDFLRLSYSFFLTYLRYDGIDFLLSFCYKRKF